MRFVSLHTLSQIAERDPRTLAADLERLGIKPDAELEQRKRTLPLFAYDRLETLAKLLKDDWERDTANKLKELNDYVRN
jgi:hypothetical protein